MCASCDTALVFASPCDRIAIEEYDVSTCRFAILLIEMAGIGHCEEVLEYVLDGIPVCWPWILAVHCDFFRRIRNVGSQALSTDTSDCQLHFGVSVALA